MVEGHSATGVGGDQNANRGPDVFGTKGNQTQTSREAVGPSELICRHSFLDFFGLFWAMILFLDNDSVFGQ